MVVMAWVPCMVASRLGGDSYVAVGIMAIEVGLESVECLGSRVKAQVMTGIVE